MHIDFHGPTDRPTDRHLHLKSSDGAKNDEYKFDKYSRYKPLSKEHILILKGKVNFLFNF